MLINRRVLLADDQSTCRWELQDLLRRSGCTVVAEASNTDDTLEKFERLLPEVVVIDVALPGTTDALVAIQKMCRQAPGTAVFATAMASQNAVLMEALSMGALDFFLKPFQPTSIKICLQRNLG